MDANVLIDYLKTDASILALAARHLGVIRVASVILDEVEQLGLEDCEDLGLTVVHEPLDILQAAAASAGALSFQDHVCLALAKSHGWICLIHDKPLRRACERNGVEVMWGLRLMISCSMSRPC